MHVMPTAAIIVCVFSYDTNPDTFWFIAERLSARLLIVQCSGRIWASVYIYINVCNAFGPGDHPGGKHVLKMASSTDSVEERRRLQGRVRTQRYRDHQNKDARAQRRQTHHDRQRAVHQRATEARWRLQEPTEERSVCTTVHFNSSTSSKRHFAIATTLYQLRFQTTLTTLTGLHLAHTFVLQSAWSTLHVSLREASLRIRMSSTDRSLIPTRFSLSCKYIYSTSKEIK